MANPVQYSVDTIISAGNMSADVTSSILNINQSSGYCLQASWSGASPVGVLDVQASNLGTIFTTIASSAVSGNTGSYMLSVDRRRYQFIKVVYTFTSGTGTLVTTVSQVND